MAYYLVKFEGSIYANDELFKSMSGGQQKFLKILHSKAVIGKAILDQILYPLTEAQVKECETKYTPVKQDFDAFFSRLNVISKQSIFQIKSGDCEAFPNAAAITISSAMISEQYKYRQVTFFRVSAYRESSRKYHMLPKVANVKVCGRLYIALNTVDVRVEAPIVATLKD